VAVASAGPYANSLHCDSDTIMPVLCHLILYGLAALSDVQLTMSKN